MAWSRFRWRASRAFEIRAQQQLVHHDLVSLGGRPKHPDRVHVHEASGQARPGPGTDVRRARARAIRPRSAPAAPIAGAGRPRPAPAGGHRRAAPTSSDAISRPKLRWRSPSACRSAVSSRCSTPYACRARRTTSCFCARSNPKSDNSVSRPMSTMRQRSSLPASPGSSKPQDLDGRVAVGAEQLLRELDARRPAVALDLPFVGVELHLPHAAGRQLRRSDRQQRSAGRPREGAPDRRESARGGARAGPRSG